MVPDIKRIKIGKYTDPDKGGVFKQDWSAIIINEGHKKFIPIRRSAYHYLYEVTNIQKNVETKRILYPIVRTKNPSVGYKCLYIIMVLDNSPNI